MFESLEDESRIKGNWLDLMSEYDISGILAAGVGILLLVVVVGVYVYLGTGYGSIDPQASSRVLEASGYHDIRITGYRFFGCGGDDYFHTGFTATAPDGTSVTGTVCKGMWFKSNTIRLD